MGSALGVSDEKILALESYAASPLYDERVRVALEYADAITLSERDVLSEGPQEAGLYSANAAVAETSLVADRR